MSEQTVIHVRGVSKVFQTEEVRTHALVRREFVDRTRRVRRDLGAVWLRQIDSDVHSRTARYPNRGRI